MPRSVLALAVIAPDVHAATSTDSSRSFTTQPATDLKFPTAVCE
jgi:hypothetical protein